MKKRYIDYDKLLQDFLNEPILEQIKHMNFNMKNLSFSTITHLENDNKKYAELMSTENYIDETLLNESYIFGVVNNKLKIVQHSKNYILDDLLTIHNFLKNYDLNIFKKELSKIYWIDKKIKEKYIKKSQRKNKPTLYGDYNFGANILNYINDKKNCNYLGERYGIENHILEDLKFEDEETIKSKLIIVMNFDYEIIEVYHSIPYELLQKGTANLENESVFGQHFKDFNYQSFFEQITENL